MCVQVVFGAARTARVLVPVAGACVSHRRKDADQIADNGRVGVAVVGVEQSIEHLANVVGMIGTGAWVEDQTRWREVGGGETLPPRRPR